MRADLLGSILQRIKIFPCCSQIGWARPLDADMVGQPWGRP